MLTTRRYRVSGAVANAISSDRDLGHHHVMASFADDVGPSARARLGVLWSINGPAAELTVRSGEAPERPELLGALVSEQPVPAIVPGSNLKVQIELACLKTPPSAVPPELRPVLKQGGAYRSKMVTVPESLRHQWATARFERMGLRPDATRLRVGPLSYADLGTKRGRIPYVAVEASAVVIDSAALERALRSGIGKGKSYGLGLLMASAD